ncbi:MAG TPA: 50S ribosomal protein L23 [Candidatus Eisenbacteria bacterium]|nr:50S ribosomal protein L23 [Candidatus Eisenbacteria bacterium]
MKDPRTVVRRPLVTEKGTVLREKSNQYFFEVALSANKIEIKRAVQSLFQVKVREVRTMTIPGKTKRLGRYAGPRPDWKRAVVTLEAGQTIPLFEEV